MQDIHSRRFIRLPFWLSTALAILSSVLVLTLALTQPWLGLDLTVQDGGVVVESVSRDAPTAGALQPGDQVLFIAPSGGTAIALHPRDLMEEPDGLPLIADMRALFAKLGDMNDALRAGPVDLVLARDGVERQVSVTAASDRPLRDLPVVFWVQLVVGMTAAILCGWVLSVRSREAAAMFLVVSGVGLLVSSHAAALYSIRELSMPEGVFALASSLNSVGSLTFGIGMISMFLVYPRRYLPVWAPVPVFVVFGTWALLSFLRVLETPTASVHLPILVEMICIVIAAVGQFFATRGRPRDRAVLRWFGLSVVIGAGGFVSLIAVPQAVGFAPQISQGYAFALFLIIYVGLVLGVARYRLFDLEFWAFRALFYAGGVALLFLFDGVLIYTVALDRLPAFSLSLLLVAFIYLPMRDHLARVLSGRRYLSTSELFDMVSDVALAPTTDLRRDRYKDLLMELFQPIRIESAPKPVSQPVLESGGDAMDVPGLDGTGDLRMFWPHRGRRLFSLRDVQRVAAVVQMAAQFIERRRAYEAGAEEERQRINRDMHDNIGVQLLGALHSSEINRKNELIRQTLTDLRETVSNPGGEPIHLKTLLGDMRAEMSEHLASADIQLRWEEDDLPDVTLQPLVINSIRSILREGVGNILRHARADTAEVSFATKPGPDQGQLIMTIRDNGTTPVVLPLAAAKPGSGNGLRNIRARTEARGGSFSFERVETGPGSILRAALPLLTQESRHDLREASE